MNSLPLKGCTIADQPTIAAPSSTTSQCGSGDAQMWRTKKYQVSHLRMKVQFCVDVDSGLQDAIVTIVAKTADVIQAYAPLLSEEVPALGTVGYTGVASTSK